eukprot:TRINITY_DN14566_c0_g2_i1.p1 TRINITY_DN14566_c0_g2~~TRINITY_DN14566_c0_g2_i1.p1  ORF type:complete len:659 (-),score=144.97 TRINITY_DN14566_c0_g2_i1:147-2123(-)
MSFIYNIIFGGPQLVNPAKKQAVPVGKAGKGETAPYRDVEYVGKDLVTRYYPEVSTLYENFKRGVDRFGSSPCLGTRNGEGPFVFQTYDEVNTRLTNFGSGLRALGLKRGDFVGLYSQNRAEWVICEQACNAYSQVSVPLYDTLGHDAARYIINHARLSVVVCSSEHTPDVLTLGKECPTLKIVVQMEDVDSAMAAKCPSGLTLVSFADVEKKGQDAPLKHDPPNPEDLATICFTSGTTGDPKGAELSHANLIADVSGVIVRGLSLEHSDVHLSYLPLAHMFERAVQCALFPVGATIGFFRGDIKLLMDDVKELRPTIFPSVPRLFNRIYDKIMGGVKTAGGLKQKLFETAFAAKKRGLDQGYLWHPLWDRLVFAKVRAALGGRVRVMVTGSAPILPEVMNFLRICFSCNVLEGYGQTETAAAATLSHEFDYTLGHVGPPLPSVEIKLVDVPEMNYLSSDKPFPRGEVCFRGPVVFMGYHRKPDITKEAIDSDGWLHSGDIGAFLDNGCLKIIDRKKNIFKLSQGEYIAPEKIENVYATNRYVMQSFVHGDSLQPVLVAIVVPDPEVILPWAKENGLPEDINELCKNDKVKKLIHDEIIETGKNAKLNRLELVKAITLEPEPFSVDGGTMTPTFKLKRPQLRDHYKSDIASMYKGLGL